MKVIEQYFPVVLFIMLYKVVLTFESVDEILKCDHSNESYQAILSRGAVRFSIFYKKRVFWGRISVSVLALTFLGVQQGKRIIENSEPTRLMLDAHFPHVTNFATKSTVSYRVFV